MKFQIVLKNPDGKWHAKKEIVDQLAELEKEYNRATEHHRMCSIENEMQALEEALDNIDLMFDDWSLDGEHFTIEFDTIAETATVLKR